MEGQSGVVGLREGGFREREGILFGFFGRKGERGWGMSLGRNYGSKDGAVVGSEVWSQVEGLFALVCDLALGNQIFL